MSQWNELLASAKAVIEPPDAAGAGPARVARFSDPEAEFSAARDGAIVCPLIEWTAVTIAGADAQTFLQGQFTNDVAVLPAGGVHYSAFCSPKGRILANFPLARTADAGYLLVVPADIAAGFVRRLRMFVLRAKVVITPLAESHVCFGLYDSSTAASQSGIMRDDDGVSIVPLPDGRIVAICPSAAAPTYWGRLSQSMTPAGSPVWDWLAIGHGVPVVTTATQDRFVPQMLNWELLGGVSFRKGCYTGQEIVARMQYLGRLKERLYHARTDAQGIAAGGSLYGRQFGDQACGTIVNVAPSPERGVELLAVIQVGSATADTIRAAPGNDAPALELLPLPYDVPLARAPQRA